MVRNSAVLIQLIACLFIALENASAQYINGNFRTSCPCLNGPIQRNLPVNLPLANRPIMSNFASNLLGVNNEIRLPNGCPCNVNTPYNDVSVPNRLNPEDKIALINVLTKLMNFASNLLPIAEKLSTLQNLLSTTRQVMDINVPIKKLNVPIVKDVPLGAIRVARNLPMANFDSSPIGGIANDVQILRRTPITYQSVVGAPVNNVPQIPIANIRDMLLKNFMSIPVNNIPNVINTPNYPINDARPYYNLANLPVNIIKRQEIINQAPCNPQSPISNIPCNNAPSVATLKSIIEKLQMLNGVNQPAIVNLPLRTNNNQIVTANNPAYLNRQISMPVENIPNFRYYNVASPSKRLLWESQPMASSDAGRVITNVPVVPYNTLEKLPAYNGMPVIKVSESVYKLTPV